MKLSVLLVTYNHEDFIGQAIESALNQNTDFDYEILIGDDCSQDRTREIVIGYHQKHPDIIKLFLQNENIGPTKNLLGLLDKATGDYIAYLDGDDFWINSYKLQIQSAYLDSHPGCAGCFSDSLVIDERGKIKQPTYYVHGQRGKKQYSSHDIIRIIGITASNTLVFRQSILATMPSWFRTFPGHSALELYITQNGTLDYLDFHLGARRVHTKNMWATKPRVDQLRWGILYMKTLLADIKLNSLYGNEIYQHIADNIKLIFEEINSSRIKCFPITKGANADAHGIVDSLCSSLSDPRLEDMSIWVAEEAEKLMKGGDIYSAGWLYRIALNLNWRNSMARAGWIFSRKQFMVLHSVI